MNKYRHDELGVSFTTPGSTLDRYRRDDDAWELVEETELGANPTVQDPTSMTVDEAADYASGLNEAALRAFVDAERRGNARKTLIDRIAPKAGS